MSGNRLLPIKKVLEDLNIPWKEALNVKLPGKSLGFNIMKARLVVTWNLLGAFEIMDVGHGFFMVEFDNEEDRNKVINGGPWMIFNHYLSVRMWCPEFNVTHATIDKTLVWVTIPSLNLLFYEEDFIMKLAASLMKLAASIGSPVKVDLHTLKVAWKSMC